MDRTLARRLLNTVIFATVSAFAAAAGAQQYKWTENGKVRYGDTPPPGVKAKPLHAPAAPSAPAAPPAKDAAGAKGPLTPADQEAAFRKRQQNEQAAEEKAAKERASADTRRINCQNAQASLRTLQSGQRVATTNQAGERVFLDEAQRASEMERAQRAVKEWCG